MKLTYILIFLFSLSSQAQNFGGGGGSSCTVGERKTYCRDMNSTPSSDKQVEINGCSVSCSEKYMPVCLPGYLTGSHCDEAVEPSRCYCAQVRISALHPNYCQLQNSL